MTMFQLREMPAARAVLAARARALAEHEASDDAVGEPTLTFLLGGSSYSLPATSVREVNPFGGYTPLPGVPPHVVGLVNVRGRLLVALDIRPLLAIPATPLADTALLLMLAVGEMAVGLVVDQVVAVHQAPITLTPSPSSGAGQALPWLRGVDAQLSLHLDPVALIADSRLAITEEG